MKNPILKDTFREIRKTKGRFIAIFAIVAIGVAFFAGIMASAPTMRYTADRYFDDHNLMDYRILSNFGITEEDVAAIQQIEGVEGIEAAYNTDVLVNVGKTESVMRIHSLDLNHVEESDPNYINQLIVVEGRLPQKSGECVIETGKIMENSLEIGDTITLRSGTEDDIEDTFKTTEYTIVGKVNTPYYLSYEKGSSKIGGGSVNLFAYVPKEDFNLEVYVEVFVTVAQAKMFNSYAKDYFDYIEPFTSSLETLGIYRSEIRREDILREAQEKFDEGKQAYEEGLADFNEEIKKAEKSIEEGKMEILSGEIALQNNRDLTQLKMDNAQKEIDDGKAQVKQLQEQADKAEQTYLEGNKEAISQKEEASLQLQDAKATQAEKGAVLVKAQNTFDVLNALNEELDSLSLSNANLSEEIAKKQQEINGYKEEQNNLDPSSEEYKQKQELIEANEASIQQMQTTITNNTSTINQINSENPTLQADLVSARSAVNTAQGEKAVADAQVVRYEATISTIDQSLTAARQLLDMLQGQIDQANQQIIDGEKQLAEGKATAETEFAKAEAQLTQAKIDLEKGEKELEEKKAEGEEELEKAREELVKAQHEIDQIEEAKWYVLDRESHYSYMDYKGAAERMDAIAAVFPVFFFLVAALVCLTTMTRMVDEQRSQIGTMKALGYPTATIAFKYVFYAAFASFTGSLVGLATGMFIFPAIIYTAWNMMYVLPVVQFTLQLPLMLVATVLSVLVTTLAAFGACYKELIETPALLMRPKAPKTGKKILLERINFIWSRFSFTSKVTARNIFRYKKRFFMTVIGISGCTALLIAGFGIKDSISTIVDKQFGSVFQYDGTAALKSDVSEKRKAEIVDELTSAEEIDDVLAVYTNNATVSYNGKQKEVTLTVVNDAERFKQFVNLHTRVNQTPLILSSSGVIITERMANDYGIHVDDELELENEDGIKKTVKVDGIAENYVGHYVYMSSGCYKNTFDLRAATNTLLIQVNEAYSHDDSIPAKTITSVQEVDTLSFYTGIRDNFKGMIQSLDFIVIVLIISAGALAFVVLYNLTNVNISERLREIATLKVLGFHDKEVNAYVYKENLILTLVGALVGVYLGKLLHLTIMVVVELDNIMFGRTIEPFSYVVSVIITLLFAVIVNQVMKKKLKAIPMVESLKSVE